MLIILSAHSFMNLFDRIVKNMSLNSFKINGNRPSTIDRNETHAMKNTSDLLLNEKSSSRCTSTAACPLHASLKLHYIDRATYIKEPCSIASRKHLQKNLKNYFEKVPRHSVSSLRVYGYGNAGWS